METNVTLRKRHKSTELNLTFVEDNRHDTNDSFNSLPEFENSIMITQISELKEQISQLQINLMSAHEEIDNLNRQNQTLDNKLDESKKTINRLKILLNMNTPQSNTKKKRKIINVQDNKTDETLNDNNISQQNKQVISETLTPPVVRIINQVLENRSNGTTTSLGTSQSKPVKTKNTIYIFGDEQVRGLAGVMAKQRQNKQEDNYKITAMIKSNANSTQILNVCDSVMNNINTEDIIVLSLGLHEKNPFTMITQLSAALYKFRNNRVYIIKTQFNRLLNESLLNYYIKMIAAQYQKCKFVDISYSHPNVNNFMNNTGIGKLGFKLNIEIDFLTYEKLYLLRTNKTVSNLKYKTNLNNPCKKNNLKQLTLPYLFSKMTEYNKSKNNRQVNVTPQPVIINQNLAQKTHKYFFR